MSDGLNGKLSSLLRFTTNFSSLDPALKKQKRNCSTSSLETCSPSSSPVDLWVGNVVQVTVEEHLLDVLHHLLVGSVFTEIQLRLDFAQVHWSLDDIKIVWDFACRHWLDERPRLFLFDYFINQRTQTDGVKRIEWSLRCSTVWRWRVLKLLWTASRRSRIVIKLGWILTRMFIRGSATGSSAWIIKRLLLKHRFLVGVLRFFTVLMSSLGSTSSCLLDLLHFDRWLFFAFRSFAFVVFIWDESKS